MKTYKIMPIMTAILAVFSSCAKQKNPENAAGKSENNITLTIDQPLTENATKTYLGAESGGYFPINWSGEDEIVVCKYKDFYVSDYVRYSLVSGEDTNTGVFSSAESAPSGKVWAFYPYSMVKSQNYQFGHCLIINLPAQQTYVKDNIADNAFPMTAIASSASDVSSMKPLMSILRLQLKGACKVSRIVISHESLKLSGNAHIWFDETDVVTLDMYNGIALDTETNDYVELICPNVQLYNNTATLFHIVVPATAEGSSYTIRIMTDEGKVLTKTLTTSTKFTAGRIKEVPALTVTSPTEVKYVSGSLCEDGVPLAGNIWAPVNCGYDCLHDAGLFYQWGRKYGNENGNAIYDISTGSISLAEGNKDQYKNKFFYGQYCWCQGAGVDSTSTWPSEYDPCPAGWRVPTGTELQALINLGNTYHEWYCINFPATYVMPYVEFYGGAGYLVKNDWDNTASQSLTGVGFYWSSTPSKSDITDACSMNLYPKYPDNQCASMSSGHRSTGLLVRCVQK